MILVVADTSPLHYLICIGAEGLLPALYDRILIPGGVFAERMHPETPLIVREWLSHAARWLEIQVILESPSPALAGLAAGEAEAIQLAVQENTGLLLIDERRGAKIAQHDDSPHDLVFQRALRIHDLFPPLDNSCRATAITSSDK
jgi:predicted nucleic acid-binding protein